MKPYDPVNLKDIDPDIVRLAGSYIGKMHEVIPEGKCGLYEIKHIVATEEDCRLESERIEAQLNFGTTYPLTPGKYTYLLDNGDRLMSDTTTEIMTNIRFLNEAHGDILIGGWGLGIMPLILSRMDRVKRVVVVELSEEVLQLTIKSNPFEFNGSIIPEDIFTWEPRDLRFDTIYMDLWSDLTETEFKEMEILEARYKKYLKPGGWIGSWRQE